LELIDLYGLIAVLVTASGLVITSIFMLRGGKKAPRAAQDSIKTMYETYNQQVHDVIKLKDNQIKRLNANLQQFAPDNEDNATKDPINLESLAPILQERGINPELLKNPMINKLIKKYTKGMGIEEIVAIADQFGLLKGNKQSRGQIVPDVAGAYDPNFA